MDWHNIFVECLNLISMSMVCFQFLMQITRTRKSQSLLVHQIKVKLCITVSYCLLLVCVQLLVITTRTYR